MRSIRVRHTVRRGSAVSANQRARPRRSRRRLACWDRFRRSFPMCRERDCTAPRDRSAGTGARRGCPRRRGRRPYAARAGLGRGLLCWSGRLAAVFAAVVVAREIRPDLLPAQMRRKRGSNAIASSRSRPLHQPLATFASPCSRRRSKSPAFGARVDIDKRWSR